MPKKTQSNGKSKQYKMNWQCSVTFNQGPNSRYISLLHTIPKASEVHTCILWKVHSAAVWLSSLSRISLAHVFKAAWIPSKSRWNLERGTSIWLLTLTPLMAMAVQRLKQKKVRASTEFYYLLSCCPLADFAVLWFLNLDRYSGTKLLFSFQARWC